MCLHCYFEKIPRQKWNEKIELVFNLYRSISSFFLRLTYSHINKPTLKATLFFVLFIFYGNWRGLNVNKSKNN